MCELLALNSNAPTAATFSFTGLSQRAGRTGDHVDGFGMGFHDGHEATVYIDERRACDSPLADWLRTHPIRARTVIAHVRKATQGAVSPQNCHPFRRTWAGREWLFAHNGHLEDFHLAKAGTFQPEGETDSERAFCWLMQRMDTEFGPMGAPDWPTLAMALADWMPLIAAHGKFNMLLTDGHGVFTHATTKLAWVQRQHPFRYSRLVDCDLGIDLAEHHQRSDRTVVIATAPLTRDEAWQSYASGEMRLFMDGECAWVQGAATAPRRKAPRAAGLADWSNTQPAPLG